MVRLRKTKIREKFLTAAELRSHIGKLKKEQAALEEKIKGLKVTAEDAYIDDNSKAADSAVKDIRAYELRITALKNVIQESYSQLRSLERQEKITAIRSSGPDRMKVFESTIGKARSEFELAIEKEIEDEIAVLEGRAGSKAPIPLQFKDLFSDPIRGIVTLVKHLDRYGRHYQTPKEEPAPEPPKAIPMAKKALSQ